MKTYELPSAKPEGHENDRLNSSLKYLGLGALAHRSEKNPAAAAEEGQAGTESSDKPQFKSGWAGFGQRGEQARRKSVAIEQEEDDDKQIRFTIGGVGRRMTKADFIREVQKLDSGTRADVVDHSNASSALKSIARQDPPTTTAAPPAVPVIREQASGSGSGSGSSNNGESSSSGGRVGRSPRTPSISPTRRPQAPRTGRSSAKAQSPADEDVAETAVERRRRLAVLADQREEENGGKAEDDTGETPAERRRRQAALGMGGPAALEDSDSDDEGTERVPPERRGIRFAEPQRSGR